MDSVKSPIDTLKQIIDEYAHCYAFVDDETMPEKRKQLHALLEYMFFTVQATPKPGWPVMGYGNVAVVNALIHRVVFLA